MAKGVSDEIAGELKTWEGRCFQRFILKIGMYQKTTVLWMDPIRPGLRHTWRLSQKCWVRGSFWGWAEGLDEV